MKLSLKWRLFLFCIRNQNLFAESMFANMSSLLEYIMKVAIEDKPFSTEIFLDGNKIVSLWAYPGVSKNPVDRISELLQEIEMLKSKLAKNNP